jgi:hypothetical protein
MPSAPRRMVNGRVAPEVAIVPVTRAVEAVDDQSPLAPEYNPYNSEIEPGAEGWDEREDIREALFTNNADTMAVFATMARQGHTVSFLHAVTMAANVIPDMIVELDGIAPAICEALSSLRIGLRLYQRISALEMETEWNCLAEAVTMSIGVVLLRLRNVREASAMYFVDGDWCFFTQLTQLFQAENAELRQRENNRLRAGQDLQVDDASG